MVQLAKFKILFICEGVRFSLSGIHSIIVCKMSLEGLSFKCLQVSGDSLRDYTL